MPPSISSGTSVPRVGVDEIGGDGGGGSSLATGGGLAGAMGHGSTPGTCASLRPTAAGGGDEGELFNAERRACASACACFALKVRGTTFNAAS